MKRQPHCARLRPRKKQLGTTGHGLVKLAVVHVLEVAQLGGHAQMLRQARAHVVVHEDIIRPLLAQQP